MAGRRKDVLDSSLTLHLTVKERTNRVLFELAKENEATKSKILEMLLKESPPFKQKYEELKKNGIL
ncbi:hypothetical protein [Hydrogenimonas urashimensis]|uniref:hypothetical protein n=1 Tax=Hydrogenimonas urashimensis TaxID=2740515 RepID=UPI001915F847|nr:hypothetical protein [Hydrogenimonas urashimensis]